MKIVQKWVAGFNHKGELVVVSHGFNQTPKRLTMTASITDTGDQMLKLLGYQTRFDIQQDGVKLHNTAKEAVDALFREQTKMITIADEMIASARARIREIREFELTSE